MDWSVYWALLAQVSIFLVLIPIPFAIFYWFSSAIVRATRPTKPSGEWVIQGANSDD